MPASDIQTVTLPGVVDLDAVEDLRETLIEALAVGPVDIAAGAVERICTNGLFLILAAAETACGQGRGIAVSGPSAVFSGAVERLGLEAAFAALSGAGAARG